MRILKNDNTLKNRNLESTKCLNLYRKCLLLGRPQAKQGVAARICHFYVSRPSDSLLFLFLQCKDLYGEEIHTRSFPVFSWPDDSETL
jgi:hypothetical protein